MLVSCHLLNRIKLKLIVWLPFAFLAGGLAAAGAKATTPILSQWHYGKKTLDLTADEKATISAIAGLTGAATGVAVWQMCCRVIRLGIWL